MSGQILPTITHVGSQSLYGSGGGSSNYPADATFSTITLAAGGTVQPNIVSPGASSTVNINANGGLVVSDNPGTDSSVEVNGYDGSIWLLDTGGNVALQMIPDGTGKCAIQQGIGGTGIALSNVSTINGASYPVTAGSSNVFLTAPDGGVVALGTTSEPVNLQVSQTSINIPTALYATNQNVILSTTTISSIGGYNVDKLISSIVGMW